MERALIEEKTILHLKLFLEVGEEAKKEKSGRPPLNEMIYWWTRKPLIVSRAVTLLSLAPSSVSINTIKQRLHLDSQKRAFNLLL
jgi:adenine-specific DNA methylase